MEIVKIKSRYTRVNISEFNTVLPLRRVEGLALYLAERVNSSFRTPAGAGIVGNEFGDMLAGSRAKPENMTENVITNACGLINTSNNGVIRTQKVIIRCFVHRSRA